MICHWRMVSAMGCCVLIITLLSQLFALNRKVRRLLGLSVMHWDEDDAPVPAPRPTWLQRGQAVLASTAGRSFLAALVVGELSFLAIALPGSDGLLARHRHHIQPVVEFFMPSGTRNDAEDQMCRSTPQAIAPAFQATQR